VRLTTRRRLALWLLLSLLSASTGCSRAHYRLRADRDSYRILQQKTFGAPWSVGPDFNVQPHPESRFFDPTNPDDPALPVPAPRLYAYQLPRLPERDERRFLPQAPNSEPEELTPPQLATAGLWRIPVEETATEDAGVHLVAYHQQPGDGMLPAEPLPPPEPSDAESGQPVTPGGGDLLYQEQSGELLLSPIPDEVWESIPRACTTRMFEFASVRDEYQRTFDREPEATLRDDSPRMSLEDILQIALVNSREYQTRKEELYRAALRLSLERFAYELKFTRFGNGTDPVFRHDRNAGRTVNSLSVPTTAGVDKVLSSGGEFLARFANDVVLTFNGPDGFASSIGSELFAELTQRITQRDIVFEALTQSERDVVYAARDFTRFRRLFFRELAGQYYNLLLTFRSIEIATQDYFSNVRGFNEAQAKYRADQLPRFQVDQFEQDAQRGRSVLLNRCNTLERELDTLKLTMGIPPETPVNLNLSELDLLTARDTTTVTAELVRRAQRDLLRERRTEDPNRTVMLNGAISLARRMLELLLAQRQIGNTGADEDPLRTLLASLRVYEIKVAVDTNRDMLRREQRSQPPATPVVIFERTKDLIIADLTLSQRQLDLCAMYGADTSDLQRDLHELAADLELLRSDLANTVKETQLDRIPQLVTAAGELLARVDQLARDVATLTRKATGLDSDNLEAIVQLVDDALQRSDSLLGGVSAGLSPIELDMDEAMLTALLARLDLMNQRGQLADQWRRIKLAGDDLRAVLELRASQTIRTTSLADRPFDYTFDDSTTRLALTFDAPLNRRVERNVYRITLINYNVALRSLIQLEDGIKFAVRNDLRNLQLDLEQYQIAVASAALADERRTSTRLQLRLGLQNIRAQDVLEAQQAYTASLNAVAEVHIGYILNRIDLFLDLEALEVDQNGFWSELYDESRQPTPLYDFPEYARDAYGQLPPRVHYSPAIRRMDLIPDGLPVIYSDGQADEETSPIEAADEVEETVEPPDPRQ
jgi:outer membrane protein TolC